MSRDERQARLLAAAGRIRSAVPVASAGGGAEFGRARTSPERIGAIERDRHDDPARLLARVDDGVGVALALLERLDDRAMATTGHHQTLGEMTVAEMIDRFMVAHLEEHADQLRV